MVRLLLKGKNVLLDLSELRPEGSVVRGSGGTSSGPASFAVEIFDSFAYWASLGGAEYAGPVATLRYVFAPTLRVIRQGGVRRGAGMATMSIDHPDIIDFVTAKDLDREYEEGDISTFNISVLVNDYFMSTYQMGVENSKELFQQIAEHAWQTGEPGLIYIDTINNNNLLLETEGPILATNPCGEIILRHKQFCNLSIAVIRPNDTMDEIKEKVILATIWGTLQSTMTNFRYIGEEWKKNSEEERLLGVDLLGFLDHPVFQDDEQAGRSEEHTSELQSR
jgi:ribonucleoside-diphosphate reductase alpha chain